MTLPFVVTKMTTEKKGIIKNALQWKNGLQQK